MNEYLTLVPFDLYRLTLFRLVVEHGSFTRAAQAAGLTQSAVTRQVQAMEAALGLGLLERTTRSVRLTPAGAYLLEESGKLLGDVSSVLRELRERFAGARKVVRVGVSRSIGLAPLPGLFHANVRRAPDVGCRVNCLDADDILSGVAANDLDLGVMCAPARMPRTLMVTHQFADAFAIVAPAAGRDVEIDCSPSRMAGWVAQQSWLFISEATTTGRRLRRWVDEQGWRVEPAMELDSFDLIVNLVSIGMGASIVPVRALAHFPRKRAIQRIPWSSRFERQLVVVARRQREVPPHIAGFIENILF
jgi:DNA-binding transcriptional LysR family regulator